MEAEKWVVHKLGSSPFSRLGGVSGLDVTVHFVISSVPYGTRSRAAKSSHDCRRTFTDFESNVIPICRTVSVRRYGCVCTSVVLPMVFTGWGGKDEVMLSTVWVDVSKLYTVRAK